MTPEEITKLAEEQLLFNIYKDIQTPEVVGMLLDIKQASCDGDLKPLLKALRSVRRDITEIINDLKQ